MKKNVIKGTSICVLLFLVTATNLMAQHICGTVTDMQNQPIGFANIVLLSARDSSFIQGSISQEDGSFEIIAPSPNTYIIKVSSIGYQTTYQKTQNSKKEHIVLSNDSFILEGVVITAKRPDYQIKDGNLVTRIENSLLSKSGTGNDVLKHIPGIQEKEGKFTVFGKGTPIIYINGREIRDLSELDRLSSTEIRQVEVVTNPGARYKADAKAVIRIKTVRQSGDGIGIDIRSTWGQSENSRLNEQLNLNYRHNSLDIFGTFQYIHNEYLLTRRVTQDIFVDTLWQQKNIMKEASLYNNYKGELGMNYQINNNQSVGIRYSLYASPKDKVWYKAESEILANGDYYDHLLSSSNSVTVKKPSQQINAYYSATFGQLTIDFNADALWSKVRTTNEIEETSHKQASRMIQSTNKVDNKLYAGKLLFSYPIAEGTFSFGSEYTHTHRYDLFANPQEILPTTDNHIKETHTGFFAEYNRFIKIAYLNIGLRYEHISSEHSYSNFFPNIS